MAFISLDQMYGAWKRVADWVSGASNDVPKVEVSNLAEGDFVGYSTETKPVGVRGNTFLELDTKDVYIHDGTDWVVF